jgi:hypothetical protein
VTLRASRFERQLVFGCKPVSIDWAGLAQLDAAHIELAGVLAGTVDAGGDAGQRLQARGRDWLVAQHAQFAVMGGLFAHTGNTSN